MGINFKTGLKLIFSPPKLPSPARQKPSQHVHVNQLYNTLYVLLTMKFVRGRPCGCAWLSTRQGSSYSVVVTSRMRLLLGRRLRVEMSGGGTSGFFRSEDWRGAPTDGYATKSSKSPKSSSSKGLQSHLERTQVFKKSQECLSSLPVPHPVLLPMHLLPDRIQRVVQNSTLKIFALRDLETQRNAVFTVPASQLVCPSFASFPTGILTRFMPTATTWRSSSR